MCSETLGQTEDSASTANSHRFGTPEHGSVFGFIAPVGVTGASWGELDVALAKCPRHIDRGGDAGNVMSQ